MSAGQLLHRDGVALVEIQVDGVDAAALVLEIGVVRDGPHDAQRPVVQELLDELVAQQRGLDLPALERQHGGPGIDHLVLDVLDRVDAVPAQQAHGDVLVGGADAVRNRDGLAHQVLRALDGPVVQHAQGLAPGVDARGELHAHPVDRGDQQRGDMVARHVDLPRPDGVALGAAAALIAGDLGLEPLGLVKALHLRDAEGP